MGFYSTKRIDKTGALYRLIIGQRSNGKTYSVCKKILSEHLKTGEKGAYIRRFDEEITPKNIKQLFDEMLLKTKTKWNGTEYKNRIFTLVTRDENGVIIDRDPVPLCQCFALNTWETSKGVDRGYFKYIVFDEFLTRTLYLANEFVIFTNLLSSLLRNRDGTVIYMLANTVSKHAPYFREMLIDPNKLKQGEIQLIQYENTDLTIAIEYCSECAETKTVNKYFAFGNPQLKMITSGVWEFKNYPHLPISFNKNDVMLKFFINYDNQLICGNVMKYKQPIIYFFPQTKSIDLDKYILYDFEIDLNPLHTQTLNCDITRGHIVIADIIKNNRCFYSDNSTGEIIRNWLIEQNKFYSNIKK